jgi:hypothetical protein
MRGNRLSREIRLCCAGDPGEAQQNDASGREVVLHDELAEIRVFDQDHPTPLASELEDVPVLVSKGDIADEDERIAVAL